MSERTAEQVASAAGIVLLTLASGQFLMALDSSVMNVSIATVADDLDTSITGIQSAIVLYTLVMAMLMVTGGKIGSIIGRKRAFAIGLVIYCSGSLTTALAPNLTVLLFGWSLLEGIGAALIMPAIVALIAGNFPPEGRPRAYGLVGAAGAIAIAVGPLIGGLATTYASWRWVFVGEVIVGAGILLFARRMADAPIEVRPHLDLLGSVLWALGMGLIVTGVLKAGEWGWFLASEDGPSIFGMSPVFWLIVGGLVALRLFGMHVRRLDEAGKEPLFSPSLIERGLNGGLMMFFFQFVVMMGLFFVVPLFLSVALGLSAIETGIKITPLSLTMLLAAAGVPKLFPTMSPRRLVAIGFVAVLVGDVALLSAMDADATASIVTVPMLVIGLGLGILASQLGSVTVSAAPAGAGTRGRWAPEHGLAVRRVARDGARRVGPDRRSHHVVPERHRHEPRRAARGRAPGERGARERDPVHLGCRSGVGPPGRGGRRTDRPGGAGRLRGCPPGRGPNGARAPGAVRPDRPLLHRADPGRTAWGRVRGRQLRARIAEALRRAASAVRGSRPPSEDARARSRVRSPVVHAHRGDDRTSGLVKNAPALAE